MIEIRPQQDRGEGFLRNCDPEILNSTNTMNQSGCMRTETFVKTCVDRIGSDAGISEGVETIVVEDSQKLAGTIKSTKTV